MKPNVIRYSVFALLVGLVGLTAAVTVKGQGPHRNEIHIESFSWGMSSGQIARVSVFQAVLLDGSTRANRPVNARIQLLNTEGDIIAESEELRVAPGQIRFWDAPRELLPASADPTGRIQLRARIIITTRSSDVHGSRLPLLPTVELIDPGTGRTLMSFDSFVELLPIDGESSD